MKRKTAATRMQLLLTKRKLALAKRGHKLLKDKLDGLIQKFLKLKDDFLSLHDKLDPILAKIFKKAVFGTALCDEDFLKETETKKITPIKIETETKNIMGVRTKDYTLQPGDYGLMSAGVTLASSVEYRSASKNFSKILPDLLKFAGKSYSIQLMATQIIETRRRVNALEYVMIPELEKTSSEIKMKLSEMERASQVTMIKMKDIVLNK
ncbi:hypothetical protein A2526_03325 [candidate division WOR-1 bacterium RIFOXYD2_FULL_36_8]|uniref:V-type ATP synthase subunit D n=1 Tax=candidate division WOR-1 bacterium RIFOXYB2_FULL_36_35 TaxID=1802578 RepID=A0A1F4S012_UNCSA|nr:MAG: hypothetical protein A2230_00240 [candidate division WOR-1 bacterium RIFOXYA2_FULL_36_21]OGC13739.1 MAG: hypothetical protein A2290_07690 [candidate division WOR-1 bacterium RIFOXYB2_FULL_36_35]OGC16981.1 MAG: hypothetical protein A2282_06240 [candidate division WOR-1 bacterium RIFOXYA12_FULL_36_13]OGC41783.1 MAG: hypothetical protein A2526_03325 [candidate division WOR-1 bacterium RIFOXYD2_FULL_36_8]